MPVYKNETAANITPVPGETYEPNDQKTVREYYKFPKGLTLVSHAGGTFAGEETIVSSLPSSTINVHMYDYFRITSENDAVVTLTYNGASGNPDKLLPNQTIEVFNKKPRNYHSVVISGSGDGNVYVRGWK